jgi:hypothetical protein
MNNAVDSQVLQLFTEILDDITNELITDIPARAAQISAFRNTLRSKYGV